MPKNIFPRELTLACKAIDDTFRQEILTFLIYRKEASYGEIEMYMQDTVSNGLGSLLAGGLIESYIRGEKMSYRYRISPYGKAFINSLFASLTPDAQTQVEKNLEELQK